MFRSFLDGLAAMVGWRVGEAALHGARREIGRGVRNRNASAKGGPRTAYFRIERPS